MLKVIAGLAVVGALGIGSLLSGTAAAQIGTKTHSMCVSHRETIDAGVTRLPSDGGLAIRTFLGVQNQQSGNIVRCTFDGITASSNTRGTMIVYGQLYGDNLMGGVDALCTCDITDAGTCQVEVVECKP